ncbi:NAD-dependent epimerase/dehydratase family protein [Herminiimonas sp. CN]|uniref:NAD-dependent epimerase/dehydratase family protein n=1 Tax=Herminiimonas sp. CN TaxID=1349818 RepID=UPI000473D3C7|nr:NAD-dependent epimerase/dehydratase family protein [Herminiimonas sp. CN]
MSMKKILVIGGSYFAGRAFVEELAKERNAEIHVFNRGRFPLGMPSVIEHVGDREDAAQIRAAIPAEAWDAVVDFCAYHPAHIEALLANLPGATKRYVFISTTTVCRPSRDLPIGEDAAKLDSPQGELGEYARYGFDKWRAEGALAQACAQRGITHTTLRPAIIYGYYNYAPRETYFFERLYERQPIVIPETDLALFSFIWVGDMARQIIHCLADDRATNATFNLAAPELVSYGKIVEALGEITGKPIAPVRLSAAEIERQRIPLPFPPDQHLIYSGAKIDRLFDIDYTPLRSGLRQALQYYLMVRRQAAGKASP